jgi:hypothetical protein
MGATDGLHALLRESVYTFTLQCCVPRLTGCVTVVVVGDQGPEPRLRLHCSHQTYCTPCFLEVPTVAARCLHVLRDVRDPNSERCNFKGRERVAENFA